MLSKPHTNGPAIVKTALPWTPDQLSGDTVVLARQLLGAWLWVQTEAANAVVRIVETEAYTQEDPACHAYQRNHGRAAFLYGPPGTAYVYFIYGMHHCLNVVTEPVGRAGAVLIRAVDTVPEGGLFSGPTHGPSRLCKTLGITTATHNGVSLVTGQSPLTLLHPTASQALPANEPIVTTTRIGIRQAVDFPWRFYLANSPCVSVPAKRR